MMENNNLINLYADPIMLFSKWFKEAEQKEINDPNAMNLATISEDSTLNSRVVLLKSYNEKGFVFYTNTRSKKGNSIVFNPNVALNFYWKSLHRQIRIEGVARQVSEKEADDYFNSRPEESRIGAWVSQQSTELKNRKELENKFAEYSKKYKQKFIPRPHHWTGYRVEPLLIEFWQEMSFRLHDRVEYKKQGDKWKIKKLYP